MTEKGKETRVDHGGGSEVGGTSSMDKSGSNKDSWNFTRQVVRTPRRGRRAVDCWRNMALVKINGPTNINGSILQSLINDVQYLNDETLVINEHNDEHLLRDNIIDVN